MITPDIKNILYSIPGIIAGCLVLFSVSLSADAAPKKKQTKKTQQVTSTSVKKKEQSVNQEIANTQQLIDANEAEVSKNLSLLKNLEHDISIQTQKVESLQGREKEINTNIASCQTKIKACEDNLASLRRQYISVIKKMRVARKKGDPLAYIFASKSFYQAWRRMRYFQKFRSWRELREKEIKAEMANLTQLNNQLAAGRKQLEANLSQQQQAQKELAAKHAAQDQAVKDLRSQGDALRKHLAEKQAEANALQAQVMSLIAQEQEAARLAEQQRKEAERKAAADRKLAEEKAAKEKAAKEKAEAERKAREKQEAEAKQKKQQEAKKKETAKKNKKKSDKQNTSKKETKKPDKKKETAKKPDNSPATSNNNVGSGNNDYATARGRRSRKDNSSASSSGSSSASSSSSTGSSSSSGKAAAGASGFAAHKGSLPRPVNGQFSIYSRFGSQALPGMPDVKYDNPGIDAVVSAGSEARAVYDGIVSGVYVVNGFATVILINHGDYFTVYGNIGNPAVSKGDKVKQGQALGKLMSDSDNGGRTTIHFEVWKGREKLNPEHWLK